MKTATLGRALSTAQGKGGDLQPDHRKGHRDRLCNREQKGEFVRKYLGHAMAVPCDGRSLKGQARWQPAEGGP